LMLASSPASILNHKSRHQGIPSDSAFRKCALAPARANPAPYPPPTRGGGMDRVATESGAPHSRSQAGIALPWGLKAGRAHLRDHQRGAAFDKLGLRENLRGTKKSPHALMSTFARWVCRFFSRAGTGVWLPAMGPVRGSGSGPGCDGW
jgi:hypothetical protein